LTQLTVSSPKRWYAPKDFDAAGVARLGSLPCLAETTSGSSSGVGIGDGEGAVTVVAGIAAGGSSIFAVAAFRLGLIGFEVSGAELTDIPAERYVTYLVPVGGRLVVLPATI
jgi:hypothetical protein